MSAGGPLIGLTGRRLSASVLPTVAPGWLHLSLDAYFTPYAAKVSAAGGTPVLLTREADPATLLERLDGILLVGGADVEPSFYGGSVPTRAGSYDTALDLFELELARLAVAGSVPLLGICRGCQLLNVALGGTLVPHLPDDSGEAHSFRGHPVDFRRHRVRFEEGSALGDLYGEEIRTNSYHHQAVDSPGSGVRVSARADDGTAEGIEVEGAPALAVQWHPELHTELEPIFNWLVSAAKA